MSATSTREVVRQDATHVDISSDAIINIDDESPLAVNPDDRHLLKHGSDLGKLLHRLGSASLGRGLVREREHVGQDRETEPLGLVGGAGGQVRDSGLDLLADLVRVGNVLGLLGRDVERVDGSVEEAEQLEVESRPGYNSSDESLDERSRE